MISFEYPAWLILVCVLLGAGYTALLYYRNPTFSDPSPAQLWWIRGMAVLRFLAVTIIAILLLAPMLRSLTTEVEKPVVAILHDNSSSLSGSPGWDSAVYAEAMRSVANELGSEYEVRSFLFDSEVKEGGTPEFSGKLTDLSLGLSEVAERFYGQNLGAVIIASDGIYNQGANPVYAAARLSAPVFAIALGDTTVYKDLILSKVYHNRIAYLGDRINLRLDLEAFHANGETTVAALYQQTAQGRKKLWSKNVTMEGGRANASIDVAIDANTAGIQHFIVELAQLEDEVNTENNSREIFIEVIDGRQKVLILYAYPHPDVAAFKAAIERNDNYEVEVASAKNYNPGKVEGFNMVILHQLPVNDQRGMMAIDRIVTKEIPALFVMGVNTFIPRLNQVQGFVTTDGTGPDPNEVTGKLNEDFASFTLQEANANKLENLPPLRSPFGRYQPAPNTSVLLKQQLGSLVTEYPLLVFNQGVSHKMGLLAGEGFWRWRLYDWKMNGSQDATDELVNKIVQYLSAKGDKRQFRVIAATNHFKENEPVTFDAELYNDAYELVNSADVQMKVINEEGQEFPFTFTPSGKGYQLNAGHFPVGNYTFHAYTSLNNKPLDQRGAFSVSPIRMEQLRTVADHDLLSQLAERYGGEVVYPDNLEALPQLISSREDLRPVMYSAYENNPLIELKWLAWVLLGFLGLEWFARKYQGAY